MLSGKMQKSSSTEPQKSGKIKNIETKKSQINVVKKEHIPPLSLMARLLPFFNTMSS